MNRKTLIALFLLASFQLPAVSQDSANDKPRIVRFDDADAKSNTTGSVSRVSIEAGDSDAKATARIAHAFNIKDESYGRYAFTVTAPFDSKKADKVDIGSLSGLTSGTSASFDFSLLRWDKPAEDDRITPVCEKYIEKLIPGYTWKQVGVIVPQLNCNRDLLDIKKLQDAVKTINAQRESCSVCQQSRSGERAVCDALADAQHLNCDRNNSTPGASDRALCVLVQAQHRDRCEVCEGWSLQQRGICEEIDGEASVADNAVEIIKEANAYINDATKDILMPLKGLTASIKANKQSFKYVTTEAPTTANDSTEEGFGVSLAWTYVGTTSLWSVGYSHETSYSAGSKAEVCSPIGATGSLKCSEVSVGAPQKKKAEIAFLENRRVFIAGKFAIAPRLEYDFKDSKLAARLPIYLVANKEGELTAGLALGYTEGEKDKFGITVFVSKAFSFFD